MTTDQYRREGAEAMGVAAADMIEEECSFMSQHGMAQAIRAIDGDGVLVGLPGRAGSSEAAWQDVTALPDPKEGPFMVSNLPNAVNSHGRPSHVFCVRSIHKDEDGSFCAFDGYRKIWGITRYYPISSPALPQETKNDQ